MRNWPVMNATTGPVELTDRTLRDMARPVLYHYDPAFIDFFAHTCALLKRVYNTQYDVVIMQGESVLGLEAAAASLIGPGDRVLNLVSGVYGKWYAQYITRYGGDVVELAVPYNESIDPDQVRVALQQNPGIKYLSLVHAETPSGTINPVRAIGAVAREFGVLTIVDTVSGLGGEVLSPESWGMDLAVAGPQKCLGGSTGLSLIAVSPAAWDAMERRPQPLRGSFLSLLDWKTSWLEHHRFPHTPSISEIYALESVLQQALDLGMEKVAARHTAIARACRAGIRALGLSLWAAREEIAAPCCTAIKLPHGITDAALLGHLRDRYGMMITGGHGDLLGHLFRLGHMGRAAHPSYLAAEMALLERALLDLGYSVRLGDGVGAAMAAIEGWSDT